MNDINFAKDTLEHNIWSRKVDQYYDLAGFDLTSRHHDSQQGFKFSPLNWSLSWAFSRQNENIKIIRIINVSVTFK